MKFAFIAQEVAFPVETMCRVLDVTRRGLYAWEIARSASRAATKVESWMRVSYMPGETGLLPLA